MKSNDFDFRLVFPLFPMSDLLLTGVRSYCLSKRQKKIKEATTVIARMLKINLHYSTTYCTEVTSVEQYRWQNIMLFLWYDVRIPYSTWYALP